MGLGKTYSTKYLLDSNNSSGVAGQVLSTTSTGIDWVDANTVPGTGLWLANGNNIYNSNSGNVGIGQTSPTAKLYVQGDTIVRGVLRGDNVNFGLGGAIKVSASNTASDQYVAFGTTPSSSSGSATFTEKMRIDSAGRVGIGVTPESWTTFTPIQIGQASSFVGRISSNQTDVATNWYYDGAEKRIASGYAQRYTQTAGGEHQWFTAGTDNADSTITFSQKLTIKNNGNVGIGNTNPPQKLTVNGAAFITNGLTSPGAAGAYTYNATAIDYFSDGARYWSWGGATTRGTFDFIQLENDGQNQQTALSIDVDGNVGIGTTSPGAKLEVRSDGSAAGGAEIRLQHANNNTNDVVSTVNFANNAGSVGMIQAGTAGANNTGYIALFTDIAGSSAERMRVHTNGNVGIGTTGPIGKLDVVGSLVTTRVLTTGSLSLIGTDATASAQTVLTISTGVGNATGPNIVLSKSRSQSSGAVVANDPLGTIQFQGGNGTASVEGARIQSIAGSTWSSTNRDSDLLFWTTPSSSTIIAERMRITSDGNVGIGTTTPLAKLDIQGTQGQLFSVTDDLSGSIFAVSDISGVPIFDVNSSGVSYFDGKVGIGTSSPQSKLHIETGSGGTYNPNVNHDDVTIEGSGNIGLQLFSPATTYQYIAFGDPDSVNAGYLRYYHTNNEMVFRTNGSDNMVIDDDGNVGIGNTSPNTKLHVTGSTRITNDLYFDATSTSTYKIKQFGLNLQIWGNALVPAIEVLNTGTLKLGTYALSGLGTPTHLLGVTSTGQVVKTTSGSDLPGGPYLPLAGGSGDPLTGDLYFSGSHLISSNTADGSDNAQIIISGGGADGDTRGATVHLAGNENGNGGLLQLRAGVGAISQIRSYTNSSERMRITSGGNVGIGETSVDARLHISALASNGISNVKLESPGASKWAFGIPAGQTYFALDDVNDNLTTPKLVVLKTSGNVGIGTTGPAKKLTVATDTVNDGVYITTSGGTNVARIGTSSTATSGALALLAGGSTKVFISAKANENSYFNGGGNVGIGTTSPGEKLEVTGNIFVSGKFGNLVASTSGVQFEAATTATQTCRFDSDEMRFFAGGGAGEVFTMLNSTGATTFTNTVTATNFILSSDERLKENIKTLEPKAISAKWKSFNVKKDNSYRTGVIAQELEVEHPEFVETNDKGFKSVKYIDLLISKIAELEARLEKAGI